jgi:hypothetical protein
MEQRTRYLAASQGEREKMLMGSLGALLSGERVYVTRGVPGDRE